MTWPALGLVAIAAGSAVAYYRIERERRLENAMGKIVSDNLSTSTLYRILLKSDWICVGDFLFSCLCS